MTQNTHNMPAKPNFNLIANITVLLSMTCVVEQLMPLPPIQGPLTARRGNERNSAVVVHKALTHAVTNIRGMEGV